ncbi:MAG TPA: oxidoreductase [Bacteroidia bacterium]|jgi:NAD(P)-dependent dehydrogenase (short-subunit alcohol dehydrogenase family)|nr:oxidoreductase [Bacteroidia bacterium]
MFKDLSNKVIVVTGGCGLLGKSFIDEILKNNGIAVSADINEEQLQKLKSDIKSPNLFTVKLDITSESSVQSAITQLKTKYGKIDALVNNAYPRNKAYGNDLEKVTYKDFCENVDVHLGGYFLCMQQFSMFFKQQGHGNIVSMASIYGVAAPKFEVYENSGFTMPVEYAAIKAGVIHLTKYFVNYYAGKNIRFNCISPGGIFNNQNEEFVKKYNEHGVSKGMLAQEDIMGALIYLLSDASSYINGQNIIVDDGWTL